MLNIEQRSQALHELAEQAIPDSIDLWPNVRGQLPRPVRINGPHFAGRWVAAAAMVTGLVAALAFGALPWWSAPDAVSAETILDRAEVAASMGATTVSTYHLSMTRAIKDAGTSVSEVWYGGPDRQRTVQQMTGASGVVLSRLDVVFNGPETWIETAENGNTRVIHTTGTTWTRPADAPSSDTNPLDALQSYGDKACMGVRLEQSEASVAGQPTYVIVATPRPVGCGPSAGPSVEASPGPSGSQQGIRVNGQPRDGLLTQPARVTIWVDKRSFLPLKTEVRDSNGVVLDRSEVTSVEYNVTMADATFQYTPRAGVSVTSFVGGDGADVKRALLSGEKSPTPPRKSP
jgi:outer membrane lipoprotein-sorting protein